MNVIGTNGALIAFELPNNRALVRDRRDGKEMMYSEDQLIKFGWELHDPIPEDDLPPT